MRRSGRIGAPLAEGHERVVLRWLTLAGAALGLAFAVSVPLFQNPDEPSHVDRVRHQADHPFDLPGSSLRMRRSVVKTSERIGLVLGYHQDWPGDLTERADLPSFSDGVGPDRPACPSCQSYQYAHPPAYYELAAPVSAAVEPLGAGLHVLALRGVSVILAAVLPWLAWWLAIEVTGSRTAAIGAAAVAALNGPVVAATSAVNNDGLAFAAAAAVLALSATVWRDGLTRPRSIALGVAVAVAGLAKVTALPVAAVGGLALLTSRGASVRQRLPGILLAGAGAAWWLRNLVVDGRLTPGGTELFDASGPATAATSSLGEYLQDNLGLLLQRSLGLYGWAQRVVPAWVSWTVFALAALLLVAWAATAPRRRPTAVALLLLAPVLAVVTTMASSYGNHRRTGAVTGLAGRYLYPAAPLVWVGVCGALVALATRRGARRQRALGPALIVGAAAVGLASLAYCLTGLYSTLGVRTMADRMDLVAPITHAAPVIAASCVTVLGASLLAARAAWRSA